MKKILVVVLALCLILGLAACGGGGNAPANTTPADNTANTNTTPDPGSKSGGITRGEVNGNTYTNEMLKIRCDLPSGWIIYNDDQIAVLNNYTKEKFKDTSVADAIEQTGQYIDFCAASNSSGNTINLLFQKNSTVLKLMSDKQIFEAMESSFKEQFKNSGITINDYKIVDGEFCGEAKSILHINITTNGTTLEEYQIWVRPDEDYIGIITFTFPGSNDPNEMLGYFSKIK